MPTWRGPATARTSPGRRRRAIPKLTPATSGNPDKGMEVPMSAVGPSAALDDALPGPARQAQHPSYRSHEAWASQDGTKLSLGGQLPTFELFTILDIKDWLQ